MNKYQISTLVSLLLAAAGATILTAEVKRHQAAHYLLVPAALKAKI
ncbi:hypothetical protein [Loigolactobacillus zhaoyuanensis]|uniref:Uncharacterized protein n=1 Tax=Loigolactobacillus zhaoyuanensis TaxID=2486017 RepID=A0ABW8UEA6_9LACO|nr:hypothetical protein [Loigolactobacillus zhaoyuanensis]